MYHRYAYSAGGLVQGARRGCPSQISPSIRVIGFRKAVDWKQEAIRYLKPQATVFRKLSPGPRQPTRNIFWDGCAKR